MLISNNRSWLGLLSDDQYILTEILLLVLGVMGEYLGKLYNAVKQRPDYLIAKTDMKESKSLEKERITSKSAKIMT